METFSILLALCEGNPLVTGGSPHKTSNTEFDVFFWYVPERMVGQSIETMVIWDAMSPIVIFKDQHYLRFGKWSKMQIYIHVFRQKFSM